MLLIIICVLAVLSNIETIFFETGPFYDQSQSNIKKLTKRGRAILLSIVIISLTIWQNKNQENNDKAKDDKAQIDQNKRDSIQRAAYDSSVHLMQKDYANSIDTMKQKFDTSNDRTTTIITETLGKYGYSLDSSNRMLVKGVRDSSIRKPQI